MPRLFNIPPLVIVVLLFMSIYPADLLAAATANSPQLTFYAGQGADSNLVDLFPKAFKGELKMDDTHLYALGYFHPLTTPDPIQTTFDFLHIPNTRTGFETVVGKHAGLQHNWEVDSAWQLRFAPLHLGPLDLRPGAGLGISYALDRPTYEDGPKDRPEKRYRFQNFNIYELEWSLPEVTRLALVTRIHHRSGMYGLIAPSRVGSNFLALGLRYSF